MSRVQKEPLRRLRPEERSHLEREVKELRRANEILKLASAFFAQAVLPGTPLPVPGAGLE